MKRCTCNENKKIEKGANLNQYLFWLFNTEPEEDRLCVSTKEKLVFVYHKIQTKEPLTGDDIMAVSHYMKIRERSIALLYQMLKQLEEVSNATGNVRKDGKETCKKNGDEKNGDEKDGDEKNGDEKRKVKWLK